LATPTQPKLFILEEDISTGSLELFPTVWQAAENLSAPSKETRQVALEELGQLRAARLSPLIAYLLATRLTDPDLDVRVGVVEALGNVLSPDVQGRPAPETVRSHLVGYLSQMNANQVLAIIHVGSLSYELSHHTARLMNLCPNAGSYLAEMLADRTLTLDVRIEAAHLIGQVGFVDAVPMLKRIQRRIESRQAGQTSMGFAPKLSEDEGALLPMIREALDLLTLE
jgi:hypothetical protein